MYIYMLYMCPFVYVHTMCVHTNKQTCMHACMHTLVYKYVYIHITYTRQDFYHQPYRGQPRHLAGVLLIAFPSAGFEQGLGMESGMQLPMCPFCVRELPVFRLIKSNVRTTAELRGSVAVFSWATGIKYQTRAKGSWHVLKLKGDQLHRRLRASLIQRSRLTQILFSDSRLTSRLRIAHACTAPVGS